MVVSAHGHGDGHCVCGGSEVVDIKDQTSHKRLRFSGQKKAGEKTVLCDNEEP